MKTLPPIRPSREQLALISENRYGVEVIRGAAGSGKTSTAILRLRSQLYMVQERFEREHIERAVRVLVLTFNKTLSGYVRVLAEEQVDGNSDTEIAVDTFGHWAMHHLGMPRVIQERTRGAIIQRMSGSLPLAPRYLIGEVDYLLGRFRPQDIEHYISAERTGRGTEPRVDRALRRRILDQIVYPYKEELRRRNLKDWNDIAVNMAGRSPIGYDIIVVDESQDFSANQLRAIRHHAAQRHAMTFVIDTIQRIYARGFGWQETGFDVRQIRYRTLRENHRNTRPIANFAAGILQGIAVEEDGAMPDLQAATRDGPLPTVLKGRFSEQADTAIAHIRREIDLTTQTVAFLHSLGGGYFGYLRSRLNTANMPYVEITRELEWPDGSENIALCTFHSAKGLEFDHVFILGLSADTTVHGDARIDDQLTVLRRLLAVAVARARETVTIGYKPGEEFKLVEYFVDGTFEERDL